MIRHPSSVIRGRKRNRTRSRKHTNISVIIPVHNRPAQVKECLDSILSQTLPPQEIIAVNDGSTDKTSEALQEFKNQIKIITLAENRGVSHARNQGIKATAGDWLAFCDSDDLWLPKKLEKQWSYHQKNPVYEISQPQEIWIRNGKRVNPCKHHTKLEGWQFEQNLDLCLISPSGVLIHKKIFQDFGLFDESLPACEDYDLWLRLTRHKPIGLDPTPSVIKHGGHPDQLSKKYEAMDRFRVIALEKALKAEKDPQIASQIRVVLDKKLEILFKGSLKRKKKYQTC